MQKEYYKGPHALAEHLKPSLHRYIPLVELPAELNPYLEKYDIHIDAKLMNTLPLGNVKSLPAWYMLDAATEVTGKTLVEASSGNTVFSLGILAPHFGVERVRAIASPEVSDGKLALLRIAGVDVTLIKGPICPDPKDPDGAIAVARRDGGQPGAHNLGQYDNPANPLAHERITGEQIYEQLDGDVGLFCAGLGTTGTLLGTARYLRRQLPDVKIAGIVRKPNNAVPGVRTPNGLAEVSFDWRQILTEPLVSVGEKATYRASVALIRSGLLVGPSAGFAYAGLLEHLQQLEATGAIEQLRGSHAVFVCPDSPFPYALDYERVLDDELPPVEGRRKRSSSAVRTITVEALFKEVSSGKNTITLIDVREPDEFAEYAIPEAINVPLGECETWLAQSAASYQGQKCVFYCRSGRRSAEATDIAAAAGLKAYNVTGGIVEWSAKGYPRTQNNACR